MMRGKPKMMIMPRTGKDLKPVVTYAPMEHTYATVDELTYGLMDRYDANADGSLSVEKPWWAFWQRTEDTRTEFAMPTFGMQYSREVRIDRLTKLARQMGDGDASVTTEELRRAIEVYDRNGDGFLIDDELTRFKSEVGEH